MLKFTRFYFNIFVSIGGMGDFRSCLDADNAKKVTLTTSISAGTQYTLTVNGVKDRSSNENTSSDQETFTYIYYVKVNSNNDDVEEYQNGSMDPQYSMISSDLELTYDDGKYQTVTRGNQTVGLRFVGVDIPRYATINNAYIQFTVDEQSDLNPCVLTITGEYIDNAPAFTAGYKNVSDRDPTPSSVEWVPEDWNDDNIGDADEDQCTKDISDIIQDIVNLEGWSSENSLVIIISVKSGSGRRVAVSHDKDPDAAPRLYVEFE